MIPHGSAKCRCSIKCQSAKTSHSRIAGSASGFPAVLTREQPLRLWAIVDEAAFHRQVGGREVMQNPAQAPCRKQPICPTSRSRPSPTMSGRIRAWLARSSSCSSMIPGASDVVYVESGSGDLFMESQTDVTRFTTIFEHLRALALPPDASVSLVMSAARDL